MFIFKISLLVAALGLVAATASAPKAGASESAKLPEKRMLRDSLPAEPGIELANWERHTGEPKEMFDGNNSTYMWIKDPSATSTMAINIGYSVTIYDISMTFASGGDYLRNGYFEWSNDGKHYNIIDNFSISSNETVNLKAYGVSASYLRLHAVDDNNKMWVKIAEISINKGTFDEDLIQKISFVDFANDYLPTDTVGFETSLKYMVDEDPSTFARFSGVTENKTYIQFDFKEAINLKTLRYQNSTVARDTHSTNDRIVGANILYNDNGEYKLIDSDFNNALIDTYDVQNLYFEKENIVTDSIRVLITAKAGWVIAGDFYFNEPIEYPVIYIESVNASSIYQGSLENIKDDSEETFCWFAGKIASITYDFERNIHIWDYKFKTGNGSGGDTFEAEVEYCRDGEDTYNVIKSGGLSEDNYTLPTPVGARYVRLTKTNDPGWNAIKYFIVNSNAPTIEEVGNFTAVAGNDDINAAIDSDFDTTVWYDWHYDIGSYILLDLKTSRTINDIYFLQGGFTNQSESALTDGNNDMFSKGLLQYSADGENWTNVDTYLSVANVYHSFATPVSARYIRMTYNDEVIGQTGVVIREFGVNLVKADPIIEFGNYATVNYNGEAQRGFYRFSYASGCSVSYINARTEADLGSVAPINPGEYKVRITSSGNDIYNAISPVTRNMHIMDTYEHFVANWNAVREEVCEPDTDAINALKDLIDRYDHDLSDDVKAQVNAYQYTDSMSNTYTIAQGIAFARTKVGSPEPSNLIASMNNKQEASIIVIVLPLTAIASLAFMALYLKKRKEN